MLLLGVAVDPNVVEVGDGAIVEKPGEYFLGHEALKGAWSVLQCERHDG